MSLDYLIAIAPLIAWLALLIIFMPLYLAARKS